MKSKKIDFLYGILIITLLGAGIVFWVMPKIYQSYPYTLLLEALHSVHPSSTPSWEGQWVSVGSTQFSGSGITISSLKKSGFVFHAVGTDGGDVEVWTNSTTDQITGKNTVSGTMSIDDNMADYKDSIPSAPPSDPNDEPTMPCTATFTLSADGASLVVKTDCSEYYAGDNVDFNGTYRKDIKIPNVDLRQLYAFKANPQSYSTFTDLVGTNLETFQDNDMTEAPLTDTDNFGASVSAIVVAHLETSNESIIMVAPGNQIWAATTDINKAGNARVLYFTNVPAWKAKLPKTIKQWMRNFNQDPIVFENK